MRATNQVLCKYEHVRLLDARHRNGESLEFSTRKLGDLTIEKVRQLELLEKLLLVVQFELGVKHLIHGHAALDGAGDVVDILRLDERLEVVL